MRRRPSGSNSEDGESPLPQSLDPFEPDLETHVHSTQHKSGDVVRWDNTGPKGGVQNNWSKTPYRDLKTPEAAIRTADDELSASESLSDQVNFDGMADFQNRRKARLRSPWATSLFTVAATLLSALLVYLIVQSFLTHQLDPKGCELSYMRPAFAKYSDFDTEHTRFASKYSLYLYREGGIDEDTRARPLD